MCGLLASEGPKISENRVGKALHVVRPDYHNMRVTKATQNLNPRPYRAEYFGEKLHIDQNEKLVMFGVTHVCAIDGYSGKIVAFVSMLVKNTVQIYEHAFRLSLHGYKFYMLILSILFMYLSVLSLQTTFV